GVVDEHHDTSVPRPACTDLDADLAPQVSGAETENVNAMAGRECPLAGEMYPRSGGKAVHGGIHGFHAYPRRLRLGHAEALIDVQRLPEKNPRGIGPPRAERRFREIGRAHV